MLLRLHPTVRRVLALLDDLALLASMVAGVLAVVRPLTPAGDLAGRIDILVVITVIAVFYSLGDPSRRPRDRWRGPVREQLSHPGS